MEGTSQGSETVEDLLRVLAPGLLQLAAVRADPNLTRVARELDVSQSTLSRAVARWSQAVGRPLIEQRGREIALTEEGRVLGDAAREACGAFAGAFSTLSGRTRPRVVSLGGMRSLSGLVGELVTGFHAENTGVRFVLREGPVVDLLAAMDAGELDVAVLAPQPAGNYSWLPVGRQSLVLVVPRHHPLADAGPVRLCDVADQRFVALDDRHSARTQADRLWAAAGRSPQVVLEADDLRTLRDYVAGGLGLAILPVDSVNDTRLANVALAVEPAEGTREVGLAWPGSGWLPPAGQAFLAHVRFVTSAYPSWADLLHG